MSWAEAELPRSFTSFYTFGVANGEWVGMGVTNRAKTLKRTTCKLELYENTLRRRYPRKLRKIEAITFDLT